MGKKNGRGAYLCDRRGCWERALTTSVLAKALHTELTHESLDELRRFAASLPDSEPAADAVGAGSNDHA